jgi:predicted ATP-grasp superfamily ATP-dependent carboligase
MLRVLLYEWCCSGGADAVDREPIAAEGRAMLEALARDAVRDGSLAVTVFDGGVAGLDLPRGVRRLQAPAGRGLERLLAESPNHDRVILVAPETDGLLANHLAGVRAAGGRLAGCSERFAALTADKQATVVALAAAGVPVPAGRLLAAGEPIPTEFHRPAVRKARAGVGCDGLRLIRENLRSDLREEDLATEGESRLEAFVPGASVGVSCLCGPLGVRPLPPMLQLYTGGDQPRLVGLERFDQPAAADRGKALAIRAIEACNRATGDPEAAAGWVGVDMILGDREDGRADRVLELNPRLTTSFVGLSAMFDGSLVRAIIDAAEGCLGGRGV